MVLVSGLLIGLLGSLHCIGMCGPIATVVQGHGQTLSPLIYNMGRVMAYLILGLVFGLIGEGIALFGIQQTLSVFMGITVIVFALYPRFQGRLVNTPWHRMVISPLRKLLTGVLKKGGTLRFLFIGFLNGLLPCGLVYLAIASGLALVDLKQAVILMMGFGLGTLPMMLGIGWGAMQLKGKFSKAFRLIIPGFAVITGVFLVVRGLALDIPYLSPVASFVGLGNGVVTCH
ncbi:sulfite exporter TauE/SafE family protein [Fulvivirga sp. M361]|uniref:sulfite exporter TauE/SafE family protein n=1 Tax=Fulvivirga sp. M361 TaxID=2594266 RepID=UPI00117B5127|nr:sulfite exporter TauE/SafE family protein [Fulvivirga sp. M361]TRX52667.1 sulfite exporter TauE/SafE family protein [Fulvivirga sp. M361]